MNPNYESTFVFKNDFPALLEDTPSPPPSDDPLFQMADAKGTCRVMCFHPKTNKTLPVMTLTEIEQVIDEYVISFVIGTGHNIYGTLDSYIVDLIFFQMEKSIQRASLEV